MSPQIEYMSLLWNKEVQMNSWTPILVIINSEDNDLIYDIYSNDDEKWRTRLQSQDERKNLMITWNKSRRNVFKLSKIRDNTEYPKTIHHFLSNLKYIWIESVTQNLCVKFGKYLKWINELKSVYIKFQYQICMHANVLSNLIHLRYINIQQVQRDVL